MKDKGKVYSYVNLTLAMTIAGSAVVVSKLMVNNLPTFLAAELGIFIGMIILWPLTFYIKKERYPLDFRTHIILFMQALLGIFAYRVLTFYGLQYTSAANSGLITSASPIVVVLLACIMLKEKIKWNGILGLLFVSAGLLSLNLFTYVTEGSGSSSLMGNAFIMAAVICEALFSILSKVKCRYMSPIFRTTVIVIYAFVCLLPFAIKDAIAFDFSRISMPTILCLLYYGVFVTVLSYIFWFRGIEHVGAGNAAVFKSVVPVSSILLAVLLLKETVLPIHIIGMVCIIAGIGISCKE